MTLRRSKPLARRKELAGSPLRRKTAMRRIAQARRAAAKRRDTGPDAATKAMLWSRARGCCELCGVMITGGWPGFSRHHRNARGMGGRSASWVNHITNLLLLCGSGVTGCHGAVERNRADAYAAGWLVRTSENPAEIPVYVHRHVEKVYLDPAGTYAEGSP
jgi:hypothetical protein